MKKTLYCLSICAFLALTCIAEDTQLTIYNQNFAVVKETRALELKAGENEYRMTDITAHLEPDSVVLRDVKTPTAIRILEQNYESDPLSEGLLLRKSEGKTLDFEITLPQSGKKIVQGTILRSGYVPHSQAYRQYGRDYMMAQQAYASPQDGGQPIIQVEGKIVFGLPGKPIFDALDPEAFLKPTLLWLLDSAKGGRHDVEFSYLTGGMRWEATYNAVAPEKGDEFDLVGWVTLENMSGKDFDRCRIKLMAGDVARAQPAGYTDRLAMRASIAGSEMQPQVTERSFEEYHLYTLERETALLDRETKQVEFLRADKIPGRKIYVYDGFQNEERFRSYNYSSIRTEAGYGIVSNPKVWAMLEFKNDKASGLGMPLPKGKVKVYRRDMDARNEFIGEDEIDHTPQNETVRLYIGNAFDLVGERRQISFKLDSNRTQADEAFEIKVRNHKKEAVEVRVVEHLYRWLQWEITNSSQNYTKLDSKTVEFQATLPPDGQAIINYEVHYSW